MRVPFRANSLRRLALWIAVAGAVITLPGSPTTPAFADGGEHEGRGGEGGGGDHGSKGSGGGTSGNSGASSSGAGGAKADDGAPANSRIPATADSDQNLARDALLRGWIQPLDQVLLTLRKSAPGTVLDVSLQHSGDGAWTYNFVVLSPAGRYRNVSIDAARNRILQIK
jgi:hypothetical protein